MPLQEETTYLYWPHLPIVLAASYWLLREADYPQPQSRSGGGKLVLHRCRGQWSHLLRSHLLEAHLARGGLAILGRGG